MPVVVQVDVAGGTEQQYDEIAAAIFPGGKLPEGWQLHLAGPVPTGWRVINVVPSQEQFESFSRDQLGPAAQRAGDALPQVSSFPLHKLIRASRNVPASPTDNATTPVAVQIYYPDGSQRQYEEITGKVFPEGKIPQGWLLHIAFPADSGWRLVNVVQSQEQFELFVKEKLLSASQEAKDSVPQITFFPVHTLLQS
jgi:hypothetical protein